MYESWFRFRRRPFSAAPRSDDYFPSEASEHARKTIISCVTRSAGPAVLIGGPGSGKTTSCHQFLGHFRTRTSVALIACTGISSRRTFFQNILFELGRPYRELDEGELRLSLIDFLTKSEASRHGTVLVFDDAHELLEEHFEDLSMLCGLLRDNNHCVHLILTGTVRLEERLGTPKLEALHQRIAARCYLEPFRIHETEAYIRRQFERADTLADEVLIDGALGAIHKCTGGTPRLINQLCDHALVLAAAGGHMQLDDHGIHEAWSDLQHLPPPEINATPRRIEDVVEFGDLDEDPLSGEATEDEYVDRQSHAGETATDVANSNPPALDAGSSDDHLTDDHLTDDRSSGELADSEAKPHGDSGVPTANGKTASAASSPHDAERQLDEIIDHLDDYQSLPYPLVDVGEDPFLEVFASEELVIRGHGSMLNRLADRQPEVFSDYGQELIATLAQLTEDTAPSFAGNAVSANPGPATDGQGPLLSVRAESTGPATNTADGRDRHEVGRQTVTDLGCAPPRVAWQELVLSDVGTDEQPSSWPSSHPECSGQTDELGDQVADQQDSGSFEAQVAAGSSGLEGDAQLVVAASEAATSVGSYPRTSDEQDFDSGLDSATLDSGAAETTESDADQRTVDQDVVTLTVRHPTIDATTDSLVDLDFAAPAGREPQEPVPTIVRVVEVNTTESDSSQPRRRFKQLFSDLTGR